MAKHVTSGDGYWQINLDRKRTKILEND